MLTDADRLAVIDELLARPRCFRDDLTVVYDYRDEVRARLEASRQRDTLPAPAVPPSVIGQRLRSA